MISRILRLFQAHSDLLIGYSHFLPTCYVIKIHEHEIVVYDEGKPVLQLPTDSGTFPSGPSDSAKTGTNSGAGRI